MYPERFIITFDGEEATDLYGDLVSLEVELSDDLPATFTLQLAIQRLQDGAWTHLDDERLQVWQQVTVHGGFSEHGTEELLEGYLTQVRPRFDPDPVACTLEVSGMDRSVLMDRAEKLKAWTDKKDSDIAADIFGQYGIIPAVEDTSVIHDEARSTVVQRETDLQFLHRLALRNGFVCWVEEGTGHFETVPTNAPPQPVLAAHFGEETSLQRFTATVDALKPAHVSMYQVDRASKEVLSASAEENQQEALGEREPGDLRPESIDAGRVYVGKNAATGRPEMTALCEGLFQEGTWFVTGEGTVNANAYGHVLRPRGCVTIKGVGETHSGVYRITQVRHTFTPDGYEQFFRVKRNALLPTGSENFSSNGRSVAELF